MELDTTTVIGLVGGGMALVSPALLWMKSEHKVLRDQLQTEQAERVTDLKAHQAETRAVLTEVHEMVTALKRSSSVSVPPRQDG